MYHPISNGYAAMDVKQLLQCDCDPQRRTMSRTLYYKKAVDTKDGEYTWTAETSRACTKLLFANKSAQVKNKAIAIALSKIDLEHAQTTSSNQF